jgi:hypothetical protein
MGEMPSMLPSPPAPPRLEVTASSSTFAQATLQRGQLLSQLEVLALEHATIATGQVKVERTAVEIGLEVDFGREAATRATGSLMLLPPCTSGRDVSAFGRAITQRAGRAAPRW